MDENFADVDERKEATKFKKTEYMKLTEGQHTIRILQSPATKRYTHYVNNGYLECLGDSCPICENNRKIMYENPDNFRDVKGWCPRRERFWVNVLDKTSEPTVKVLSSGPTLFEDFKDMSKATRNESDEVVDIRAYDWTLMVKGNGRDRETTPVPQYRGKDEPVSLEGLELFDLSNPLPKLTPEEMLDVFNGASVKDIFVLRRAKEEIVESEGVLDTNLQKEIQDSVDQIFKQ